MHTLTRDVSRRQFLRGAAASTVVVGWNAASGGWITAEAAGTCSFEGVPPLDGLLLHNEISRTLAADDYGNIVHRKPCAVLRPGSVQDIVKIVRFARERHIKVSMRGNGHSSYGQSQVEGGIVIDSATLARIHTIKADRAVVDAGVLWRTLIVAAATRNVTPPVLTDFQDLTVGGTLSIGGADAGPMPYGYQVDNVLELQVVTGQGELVTCSPTAHRSLFNAVLAGLGQCAIIVRATIRMIPLPAMALLVKLRYTDLHAHLADLSLLIRDRRFDSFESVVGWEDGRWVFDFQAAAYFTPPRIPDTGALLAGLHDERLRRVTAPIPYLAWPFRLDHVVAVTKAQGLSSQSQFVCSNGAVPEAVAPTFLGEYLASHTAADLGSLEVAGRGVGGGRILLFSGTRSRRPLLRLPDSDIWHGFLVLRGAQNAAQTDKFLAASRDLYDRTVAAGGTRYPWDAVPNMTRSDWRTHYGSAWSFIKRSKRRHDPANILGSDVGIFAK